MDQTILSKSGPAQTANSPKILGVPQKTRRPMGIHESAMKHIVKRLTDLYQNPLEATIRETISNAQDAMVAAGNTSDLIEIYGPSIAFPYFQVVDYGTGMSEEEILGVYATYGSSSKEEDFDQVGAYGLGAKAPLAYTRSFSVETTKNGITTKFSISREDDGNYVDIHSSEETGNSSGTSIKIPVLTTNDYGRFSDILESYANNFGKPVKINNVEYSGIDPNSIYLGTFNFNGVESRVWIENESSFLNLYKTSYAPTKNNSSPNLMRDFLQEIRLEAIVGGWKYSLKGTNDYRSYATARIKVELVPGVVDFSSSRDEITKNERSESLIKSIQSTLFPVEDPFRNLNNVFKTFPKEKALKLFFEHIVVSARRNSNFDYSEMTLRNGSGEVLFDFSDLLNDSLMDILKKTLYSTNSSVVSAGFNNTSQNYSAVLVPDTIKKQDEIPPLAHEKGSIGSFFVTVKKTDQKNEMIKGGRKDNFFRVLYGLSANGKSRKKILVVSGTNSEERKQIYLAWKIIFDEIFQEKEFNSETGIIFVTSVPKNYNALDFHLGFGSSLEIKSSKVLMEEIKKIKIRKAKEARLEREKLIEEGYQNGKKLEPIRSASLLSSGIKDAKDLYNLDSRRCEAYYQNFDSSEVTKNGALFVFVAHKKAFAKEVLNGAANHGIDIYNKKIYVINENNGRMGSVFKELEGYKESLFFHPDFPIRSEAAKKASEGRVFCDFAVKDALKYSERDIFFSLLYHRHYNNNSTDMCGAYLNLSTDSELTKTEREVFKLLLSVSQKNQTPEEKPKLIPNVELSYALETLPKDLCEKLLEFSRILKKFEDIDHYSRSSYYKRPEIENYFEDSAIQLLKSARAALRLFPIEFNEMNSDVLTFKRSSEKIVSEIIKFFLKNQEGKFSF